MLRPFAIGLSRQTVDPDRPGLGVGMSVKECLSVGLRALIPEFAWVR